MLSLLLLLLLLLGPLFLFMTMMMTRVTSFVSLSHRGVPFPERGMRLKFIIRIFRVYASPPITILIPQKSIGREQVVNGGLSRRHGANIEHKQCAVRMHKRSSKRGVCAEVKRCSTEGCPNQAKKGGLCVRHGAMQKRKICSSE